MLKDIVCKHSKNNLIIFFYMQPDINKIQNILQNNFSHAKIIDYGDNYGFINIEVADDRLVGMNKVDQHREVFSFLQDFLAKFHVINLIIK